MAMLTTLSTEDLIPADHPIRRIRVVVDAVLAELDPVFDEMYASGGRRSVPPEQLLKATVLMAMYSIRSERAFCERLNYDLLFKWFLDMRIDQPAFDATTFSKNRKRLLEHQIADEFFAAVVRQAKLRRYMSSDHFSVDGTLLEAWASHKSFKPKDEPKDPPQSGEGAQSQPRDHNGWSDFKGEKRSNDTHQSQTDPEALLYRKGKGREAKLYHSGHALMENRNGLLVALTAGPANGHAERNATCAMIRHVRKRHWFVPATLGEDAGFRGKQHASELAELGVVQHIAGHKGRKPRGWTASQRCRKRIEQIFGWVKEVAGLARTRFIQRWKTKLYLLAAGAKYNRLRMKNLGLAA